MNQTLHRLRLFFCFFSGEDDFIIRKCNARIQIGFAIIGLCVLVILSWCFISAFYFTEHLFHNQTVDIVIGIVWALLVTNLYLLLLYTISPALLPVARRKTIVTKGRKKKVIVYEKKKEGNPFRSFSFLFRTGLITFLAILMTQPLNVLFLASYEEANKFAATTKEILRHNPLSWIITTLGCIVFLIPVYFKFRVRKISETSFENDFEDSHALKGLKHLREQLANPTDVQNLQKQILSLKINEIKTSDFYFQKTLIEHRIVLEEYQQFKNEYCLILKDKNKGYSRKCWENLIALLNKLEKVNPNKYQIIYTQMLKDLQDENIERYEYWADHPFRTKHKTSTRKLASEDELLQNFYHRNS